MKFTVMRRAYRVLFVGTFILFIFMFGYGSVSTFENKDYILCLLFLFYMLSSAMVLIYDLKKWWREELSTIQFDKDGIRNQVIWKNDIFIPWSECSDIGVGIGRGRYDTYRYIYFSKERLLDEDIHCFSRRIKLNSTHLWIQYRPKVLAEITKYIDESEIKGLELIKKKRKRKS